MKSNYLILDMQSDLIYVDGPNGKSPLGEQVRARDIAAKTAATIKKARYVGIKRNYYSGVSTQAAVKATVRDVHDRDFDIVVVEDACCTHYEEDHKNSMASIPRFCRAVSSDAIDFTS